MIPFIRSVSLEAAVDVVDLPVEQQNPDEIVANWDALSDSSNQQALESGGKQTEKFVMKAMAALKA